MASLKPRGRSVAIGRARARDVLRVRARALRRRTAAVRSEAAVAPSAKLTAVDPALKRAVGGAAAPGVAVAEGDSWFDHPLNDVLHLLEDLCAYEVESVAHKGDPVEEMAYGQGQLEELTRRLEKLLRRDLVPKAILLSGGGNDVAGPGFGMLLNHASSPVSGLSEQVLAGVIGERVRLAYVTILSAVTQICEERIGRRLPILVHGYDYPVPDGRGFVGGWWFLPGPWLEPGFREKGFQDLRTRIALAWQLIDRFNAMLEGLVGLADFSHVTYLDLRGSLSARGPTTRNGGRTSCTRRDEGSKPWPVASQRPWLNSTESFDARIRRRICALRAQY